MNEILTALCNKGHGFATACFPVRSDYVPRSLTVAETEARKFMGLARADTDYFVHFCLGVLLSEPDLCAPFNEQVRTYLPGAMGDLEYQMSGGDLVVHKSQRPGVARKASEWPPEEHIQIQLLGSTNVQISVAGNQTETSCAWTGSKWVFAWPEWSGVSGAIRPFGAETSFDILHKPSQIDLVSLVRHIESNTHCRDVLMRGGAEGRFYTCVNPRRAVALFLQTLALLNT